MKYYKIDLVKAIDEKLSYIMKRVNQEQVRA